MFDFTILFVYFNKIFIEKMWVLKQNQLKASPTYGEHFYEYNIKQAIEQSRQESGSKYLHLILHLCQNEKQLFL